MVSALTHKPRPSFSSQPDLLSKAPPTHRWAPPIGGLHTAHDNHLFCNTYLRSQFQPFHDNYFLSTLINNKSAANYSKNRSHKERRARWLLPPISTSPAPSLSVMFGCALSFIYKLRLFPQRQVSLRGELYSNRCPELQRHSHRSPGDCNPPTITTTTSSSPLSILTPPSSHPHPHPHQSRWIFQY